MNKVIDYFFDKEEKDLVEDYKHLGIIAIISLIITLITILQEATMKEGQKEKDSITTIKPFVKMTSLLYNEFFDLSRRCYMNGYKIYTN